MALKYDEQIAKQQADLNTANQGKTGYVPLKVDGLNGPLTQTAVKQYGFNTQTGAPNTPVNPVVTPAPLVTPTPADNLTPAPTVPLTTPATPSIYTNYTTSLAENVDSIKANLDANYKQQLADIAAKKKTLETAQTTDLTKMDPTQRATYDQEQTIKQNELNASETASKTIEADFLQRRALTDELSNLLTQGNALIEEQKNAPVGQSVINKRLNSTMTDISARTGVIQAVFSALDGNISQAHNIINQAQNTVTADWNDNLAYYNTLLDLNSKNLLEIDTESKSIAKEQVNLIKNDLTKVEKTSDYLKGLMTDPDSAQFVADAGIKLTDSIEEINLKLSTQSKTQEIIDTKNEMVKDGYTYVPFPTSTVGLIPITAGDKTMYFKPKVATVKTRTSTTPGSENILSLTKKATLLSIGMKLDEINNLESDVNTYGLEEALKGVKDETTKQKIREAYGGSATPTSQDAETYIRDNLDVNELKKFADWAKVSKWWRGKAKDVNAFFSSANADTLNQIKTAVEQGYTVDEIITFLNQ